MSQKVEATQVFADRCVDDQNVVCTETEYCSAFFEEGNSSTYYNTTWMNLENNYAK